jgi:hypothetical protein
MVHPLLRHSFLAASIEAKNVPDTVCPDCGELCIDGYCKECCSQVLDLTTPEFGEHQIDFGPVCRDDRFDKVAA